MDGRRTAILGCVNTPTGGYASSAITSSTRTSGARAALVSAALFGAGAVILLVRDWAGRYVPVLSYSDSSFQPLLMAWYLGTSLLFDIAFIAVVYLRPLTPARRTPAVLAAVAVTVVDIGVLAPLWLLPDNAWQRPFLYWIANGSTVLFVAAWGVARRRKPLWVVGLVPALLVTVLAVAAIQNSWPHALLPESLTGSASPLSEFVVAAAYVLTWWVVPVGLGCVACWVVDHYAPERSEAVAERSSVYAAPPAAGLPTATLGYGPTASTNSMAIVALVTSLVFGPLGIVFGHIALSQIKQTGEAGNGLAIAGLVIGYVSAALLSLWFVGLLAAM